MQSVNPLRLRPVIQRFFCVIEARRASRASISKTNQTLIGSPIPQKPKKPGNPFLQFMKDVQTKIYADNPDASRRDLIKTASVMWREADDNIKERYSNIFKEKSKEYEKQIEVFNRNLTTDQKLAIAQAEELAAEKKKVNSVRKTMKNLGKPSRPPSAYGLFIADHPQRKMFEGETNKTRVERVTKDWKNLPESEKTKYRDRAETLLNNFNHDVKQWETSMLKKFKLDDDEIEAMTEFDGKGKPRKGSKKLSNYISLCLKNNKKV